MRKTTVYLPDELKSALELAAARTGSSEADVIRTMLREFVRASEPPAPRLQLVSSREPTTLAERMDEGRSGFGE